MAAAGASGLYVNPNTGAAQAGLAPFRNAVINGDMRINQRGTSTNLASLTAVATADPGSWVADRWNVYRFGFVAGGVIGQGTNLTTGDLPFNDAGVKTFARIGRLSGNTATNPVYFAYNMESQDCYRFVGKTVTLSFYYRTGANFSSTFIYGTIRTGTGTDQSSRNGFTGSFNAGTATISQNASWQRISLTCTLGTNINQIGLLFYYDPFGTAGAADYFDITGVQLELGSVATPFEVRPYPVEVGLCMRYYQQFGGKIANDIYVQGYIQSAGQWLTANFTLPSIMRVNPIIKGVNGTWGLYQCDQPVIVAATTHVVSIKSTASAGGMVSYATTGTNTTYIYLDSEL